MKDLSKLIFGTGSDLLIKKCNKGISLFTYILLEKNEAKKRVIEEKQEEMLPPLQS